MALAPADFYAYSQATGTPLPESPQERANLAPEVLNFRRNQLKAPQAEQGGPDPLSLGIGIGLGLAGIGGVAYGAKRFLGGRQRIPKAPPTAANAGTVVQDLEKVVNYGKAPAPSQPSPSIQNELNKASVSNQAIAAVESGEDQMTGRVMRSVQRNEDLDVSEVNAIARQTGSADLATSATPDGIPFDQTEINQPITAQELAAQAKEQMISLRQSLEEAGYKPGTVNFERALAQPFRTSSSTSVTGTQPIEFSLPEGPIRRTVQSAGAQEPLIEKSVPNIGPEAVVTSTAAGTAIRGASPVYHEAMPKESMRQLYGTPDVLVPGAPDELGPDLPGSLRVRGGITPDVEPQFLSKQEITYSSLDRPQVPGPAGGSAGIGVYGIESSYVPGAMSKVTGGYSAASSRKPTDTPAWIQKRDSKSGFEALTTPQLVSAAEKAQAPRIKSAFEKEIARRDITKQSLEASEIARRAIIEGRDPQAILRQRGFNV